ncbi:hypothetical protein QYM36_005229 [Artemia franciscana]|uniref:EF-hand domain-containing protein n=1 Tax=Artemia franciscana TaxID=6661 RepID=A0AA88I1H7_ARTSF|nr:hypothetical protein QYM36_005229 [Artemia franciscana]
MLHKKHYYDAIIEKNKYCLKYSGFLPDIFKIEDVKNLETAKNSDTEEVKKALDKLYDSQESDESEDAFNQMDVSKEGKLTMEEVIKGLKLEDTPLMRYILSIFDKDKNNIFDLNEFKDLYGTILSQEANYVFQVFDFDRDGIISLSDIIYLCEKIPKKKLGIDTKKLKLEIENIIPENGELLASKIAAVQNSYADASITSVTGGNAINVFLGIGTAWLIGSSYHSYHGVPFLVNPGR